jgi:hypothetical protein
MRNRYKTHKNNKKNKRRGNIKTRSMQRGGVGVGAETDSSNFGIDLTGLKNSLLSQLYEVVPENEEDDIPPEKKDEIVDYIKNSDYIKELRRSFHKPTDLQTGMQDILDGLKAKILEYPDKWQASRLEKKNVLDANSLLQSTLENFSNGVKQGKEMSMSKLQQLWGVVNSAKDCMGAAAQSSTDNSEGGQGEQGEQGEQGNKSEVSKEADKNKPPEGILSSLEGDVETGLQKSVSNEVPGLKKTDAHVPHVAPAPGLEQSVGSKLSSMLESIPKKGGGHGGKVNVHEHPRKYIKEIKDNRKKLYEKEMEIIRSIRNFNNGNTRARKNVQSHNKYHTRKFRRAIMK